MARSAVSASPALKLVPSGRSLAAGFALLAAAFALYAGARQTSVFAVRDIEVDAVTPTQARVVRRALGGLDGTSLLEVDRDEIQRRLDALPHVHLLGYDRAFPNRLRLTVSVERPVAVVRRGGDRWLVSAAGRVLRPVEGRLRRPLPVVWVERSTDPAVGQLIAAPGPAAAIRAIASIRAGSPPLARQVWYVRLEDDGTATAVLRDRLELRLGTPADVALKAAVARRVLATLRAEGVAAAYLDVSVPERPVTRDTLDSQVEPEASSSEAALTAE